MGRSLRRALLEAAALYWAAASPAGAQAAYPAEPIPPQGAPNLLVIMTDDVGFAAESPFGGPVPAPHLAQLAADGLVYNRFNTTAMCSPTRAALLTGRNHHAVATGTVLDFTTGYPGYWSIIPKSAAPVKVLVIDPMRYTVSSSAHAGADGSRGPKPWL